MNANVNATNKNYGGLQPQVTNVVFVQGTVDPWHALGPIDSQIPSSPSIYINGTSHCADMYQPNVNDSEDLVNARIFINDFIYMCKIKTN